MRRRRVASVRPTVADLLARTESRTLETQSPWNPVRLRSHESARQASQRDRGRYRTPTGVLSLGGGHRHVTATDSRVLVGRPGHRATGGRHARISYEHHSRVARSFLDSARRQQQPGPLRYPTLASQTGTAENRDRCPDPPTNRRLQSAKRARSSTPADKPDAISADGPGDVANNLRK